MSNSHENPCLTCGACCATFRVDFHPAELANGPFAWGKGVPIDMTIPLTPNLCRMLGTDLATPRCVALDGKIGQKVCCAIHPQRPSPCREFDTHHDACTLARRKHGLHPITE